MYPAINWTSSLGLTGALYVLLALIVTIDVLLKKSDVRSALGWIAAAWLSPFFGVLLYYLFGINRVTRRALKLKRRESPANARPPTAPEPDDPQMAVMNGASRRVTGSDLSAGNDIAVLEGGDTAYPAMLQAIAEARHSVAMASYIFRDDVAGRQFADALIAAHQRGVTVRVLLDSVGIGYFFPRILYRMRRGGVPAARFLHTWMPWRMPFLNMRNHRKLLVTDGAIAFIGGMNVGDEYAAGLAAKAGKNYVEDVHFRVQGPGVATIMDVFARDWAFTTDEELDDDCWWPALTGKGSVAARDVRSGPDSDLYKIEMMVGAALDLARKRVRIVTPYFLPDQRLQFAIAQAGMRGVAVDIVIPDKNDHIYMDWAVRGHLRFFRHIPATVHVTPPPFDHSKLVVMDDEWCLIGSSNWDARSFRLNFEFDLECYDRAFVRRIDAMIDAKIARSTILSFETLATQPIPIRLRNALARLMMPYL